MLAMVIAASFSERELCVCQYVAGFCPSCSSLRWQCGHIFEEPVILTCVGIFIVTTTFFWSWYEIAVFCIDEWSIAFGHHCLDVAHVHHHSQLHGSTSTHWSSGRVTELWALTMQFQKLLQVRFCLRLLSQFAPSRKTPIASYCLAFVNFLNPDRAEKY